MKTNKAEWKRRGDVDYIRIEARPSAKKAKEENLITVELDWIPSEKSGACEAFQALQRASMAAKPGRVEEFYEWLRQACEHWEKEYEV